MSLIVVALTLFAVVLMMASLQRPRALVLWIAALAFSLYALPGPSKVAAPIAAILALGLAESLAGLRTR